MICVLLMISACLRSRLARWGQLEFMSVCTVTKFSQKTAGQGFVGERTTQDEKPRSLGLVRPEGMASFRPATLAFAHKATLFST